MNPIVYLIQVNLFLLLFYGFYQLFLRKETFNNLNRGYLVIAAITAFAVPFLQSDLVRSWFVTQQVSEVIYTAYSPEAIVISTIAESPVLWTDVLKFTYLSVVIFLSIRLIISILNTNRLFSNFTDAIGSAFSFFGKIVVDETLEEHDTIYRHEEIHSQHLHSADVILFEVIAVVCWFNPVVYFYKNAVRNIHEFIADELASQTLNDKAAYATLLVSQQFNIAPSVLTNSFYKPSTIKLRIEMLLKKRSTKTALLKYGLIAPLFLAMMVLASATVIDKDGLEEIAESVEVPLTELPSIDNISVLSAGKTTREIEGYIKSSDGSPLAGAVVIKKGSSEGTVTNKNGYFKLNVSEGNSKLTISFVGYETREISVDGIAEVTVKLIKQENMLGEIVVSAYKNGSQSKGDEIFTTVEQNPEFPGGISEMYKYIGERIKYPTNARIADVEGKVFVKFVVQKDGDIGDIKILKGIGFGCDEEAVRVISQMPAWNPGKQNGKPVNVYFTMPIKFALEERSDTEPEFPNSWNEIEAPPEPKVIPSGSNGTGIKIRGFVGEGKPLFVIDGVVSTEAELKNINPADIASVNVLKGNAATALYGDRAEDGAVQIVTQKTSRSKDFSNNIYEVKDALYIVDGKEMTHETFEKKYGNDVSKSSIFIYKPDQAVEKFGEKGKNGVVVIKTKE